MSGEIAEKYGAQGQPRTLGFCIWTRAGTRCERLELDVACARCESGSRSADDLGQFVYKLPTHPLPFPLPLHTMDFDASWCPACERQIQPRRYTVQVPVAPSQLPPPPPPSPRRQKSAKSGLVNGTGRLKHNGTIKATTPPQTKSRLVIDQGPIPLYCSDECQMADLNTRRPEDAVPIRQHKKKTFTTSSSETESDSSVSTPPKALTSIEKFAAMYNLPPLPPPPPTFDEPEQDYFPEEYTSGVMMAGKLISSLCPKPAKPHTGRYRPAQEPRKPIPGWTDGSNAWRSTVYNFSPPKHSDDPFSRDTTTKSYTASSHRSSRACTSSLSSSALPSAHALPAHTQSEQMIAKFTQNFSRRCESRASLYSGSNANTATPCSPASTHSLPPIRRERSLLSPGAEGKLLVPDVKMKVHSGSSASLSSAWSGPTSASSRRSVRSPLSAASDTTDEETDEVSTSSFTSRRPTIESTCSLYLHPSLLTFL